MNIYEQDYIEQGARTAWALSQENEGKEWERLMAVRFRERIGNLDVSKLKLSSKMSAKPSIWYRLVHWKQGKLGSHRS